MSDPSTTAKSNLYDSTSFEREWWNKSSTEDKLKLVENLDLNDIYVSQYGIASEHAYQQEHTAKINELTKTNYNALPTAIKTFVTEALIAQGELPNPSDFTGRGLEFVVLGGKEIAIECDRCDQEFVSNEDFEDHKEFDHGDSADDEVEEAEDSFQSLMDEDVTKEDLQEARKVLAETQAMPDLGRDTIFNGKDLPQPTKYEPDDTKGERGYNDDPNSFFYNNKKFKKGSSADRYGGMVSEAYGESHCETCGKSPKDHENENHTFQNVLAEAVGADGMAEPTIIVNPAEGSIDEEYESAVTLGDIEYVNVPSATDEPIEMLKDVDFSEEKIDYVYPTKATEEFKEEKDPFLEDYGDEDIESDEEAVKAQIIDRKLRGNSTESIATELVIQYGCPREEAIEKILSIEVSTNDRVANTFFGKRFSECTEAEINELRLYCGSEEK